MVSPRPEAGNNREPETSRALSIIYRDTRELVLHPKNPRLHSKKQIQQIARSIETFGFLVPCLVDSDRRLISGHGRIAACKLLNIRKVPTIDVQHLSEPQVRAFQIADNRLVENSTWNDSLLAEQLKALAEVELNFSLEATGFEMGEIDLRIEGLKSTSSNEEDAGDQLPDTDSLIPVTHVGDLWELPPHRIICGDALNEQTYLSLMESKQAAAVFTDPPYNVRIDGFVSGCGEVHHAEFSMACGEMTESEFTEFLSKVMSFLARFSLSGSIHFVCMDWRHIGEMVAAGRGAYSELKNVCIWMKESGGLGSFYRSQYEMIFVFKNGTDKHRNNIQLGQFGRNRTNVWAYARVNSKTAKERETPLTHLHPTIKPVSMVADAILDCTARGDIVLDAFLGSGTTLIAAERVGRIAYGIELDPKYVDMAVRRWQEYTGRTAIHSASGQPFDSLKEVRNG